MKPLFPFLLMLLPVIGMGQMPARIDSVIHKNGSEYSVRARIISNDSLVYFPLRFMGLGKPTELVGLKGIYYPKGTGRRNVRFIGSKPKM